MKKASDYHNASGVPVFCVLTDGLEWRLYPRESVSSPDERQFVKLCLSDDLIEQFEKDLNKFLSYSAVILEKSARHDIQYRLDERNIRSKLPQLLDKMFEDRDEALVNLVEKKFNTRYNLRASKEQIATVLFEVLFDKKSDVPQSDSGGVDAGEERAVPKAASRVEGATGSGGVGVGKEVAARAGSGPPVESASSRSERSDSDSQVTPDVPKKKRNPPIKIRSATVLDVRVPEEVKDWNKLLVFVAGQMQERHPDDFFNTLSRWAKGKKINWVSRNDGKLYDKLYDQVGMSGVYIYKNFLVRNCIIHLREILRIFGYEPANALKTDPDHREIVEDEDVEDEDKVSRSGSGAVGVGKQMAAQAGPRVPL